MRRLGLTLEGLETQSMVSWTSNIALPGTDSKTLSVQGAPRISVILLYTPRPKAIPN